MSKWIAIGDTLLNLDFIPKIEVDEWCNAHRADTFRVMYYNSKGLIEKYEEYETDEEACERYEKIKKLLQSD